VIEKKKTQKRGGGWNRPSRVTGQEKKKNSRSKGTCFSGLKKKEEKRSGVQLFFQRTLIHTERGGGGEKDIGGQKKKFGLWQLLPGELKKKKEVGGKFGPNHPKKKHRLICGWVGYSKKREGLRRRFSKRKVFREFGKRLGKSTKGGEKETKVTEAKTATKERERRRVAEVHNGLAEKKGLSR